MTLTRVAIHLPHVSGEAADEVVNTLTFQFTGSGTPSDDDRLHLEYMLSWFFNRPVVGDSDLAGMGQLSNYIGGQISRSDPVVVKHWDLPSSRAALGNPIRTSNWMGLGAPASGYVSLPREVACCVSFRGSYGTRLEDLPFAPAGPAGDQHPRARVRGRIYVGPLITAVMDRTANTPGTQRIDPDFCSLLANLGAEYLGSTGSDPDGNPVADIPWRHVVFSQTEWAATDVNRYDVDDAFDVQRRRGESAGSKQTVLA